MGLTEAMGRGTAGRGADRGLAREMAVLALVWIDEQGAWASQALQRVFSRNPAADKRERSLATELVYGVCRRRNTLDYVLERFSNRGLKTLEPLVKSALRLGVYQILYTRIPARAAVSETVEVVKRRSPRAAGLVNAVLRAFVRKGGALELPNYEENKVLRLSLEFSHPEWLVRRWLERYGEAGARALMDYDNRTPPIVIRVNRLKTNPEDLVKRLAGEGVEARPGRYLPEALVIQGVASLESLSSFQEGLFTVQDESSMLVARVLDHRPGQVVIDMAAAPGGKTTHIAELMGDNGTIIAIDVHEHRLEKVRENCRRLGITSVTTIACDARAIAGEFACKADRVLLDAPCSGLGTLARRPDARWRRNEGSIAGLVALQRQLLDAAVSCLSPGGILVYSTCTTEPEENEGMVTSFLERHEDMELDDITPFLPRGLKGHEGRSKGWLQLLPHVHGVDGFFIARLRKRG